MSPLKSRSNLYFCMFTTIAVTAMNGQGKFIKNLTEKLMLFTIGLQFRRIAQW